MSDFAPMLPRSRFGYLLRPGVWYGPTGTVEAVTIVLPGDGGSDESVTYR